MPVVLRFPALALAAMVSISLPGLALAETLTVTGITIEGQGYRVSVPTIEATDSSLDEEEIRSLFTGGIDKISATLADFGAAAVRIPEIAVAIDVPKPDGSSGQALVTYRDFELRDVAGGIASASSLRAIEIQGPDESTMTFGSMSTGLLDVGGLLGFYGAGGASDAAEMKPLYRDFSFAGAEIKDGPMACTIGGATAAEFSARPLALSFAELLALAQEMETAEASDTPPPPKTIASLVGFYADVLTAFESTPIELASLSCDGTDEKGGPLAIRSGPLTVGGFRPGILPEIALRDFRIEAPEEGFVEFAGLTFKETDLNAPLAALTAAAETLDEDWFEANWRKILPAFAGFSVSGMGIDVPDDDRPGERVRAQIGAIDLSLADYVNGIPATVAASGSDIEVSVPDGEDGKELRALGIEKLDLSYDVAARWDESAAELDVEKFTLSGDGLGTVNLSGTLGNATPELFSENHAIATRAATSLTVKELTLELEDAGMAPALIALIAAEEGHEPEAFHVALAGMARALPLAILGGTDQALSLSNALGAFLAGSPRLSITLTATDPAGLGLAELAAAEDDPAVLKGKIAIAAEASGDPRPFTWPKKAPAPPAGPDEPARTDNRTRQ